MLYVVSQGRLRRERTMRFTIQRVGYWVVLGLITGACIFSPMLVSSFMKKQKLYSQSSPGSFCHLAVNKLCMKECNRENIELIFKGTQILAFEQSVKGNGEAFVALSNSSITNHYIQSTVQALQFYRIDHLSGLVNLPISMCLLRRKNSTKPLTAITTHSSAVLQIDQWLNRQNITDIIEEPRGTAFAAKRLSGGELGDHVGVVGPKALEQSFANLKVVACSLENESDNHTLFAKVRVSKRPEKISEQEALNSLKALLQREDMPEIRNESFEMSLDIMLTEKAA